MKNQSRHHENDHGPCSLANSSNSDVAQLVDQMVQSLVDGRAVDLEAYCRDHPQLADELREVFPALLTLAELPSESQVDDAHGKQLPPTIDDISRQPLGDFRIEREIGRGGMGIVYEAQQLSLDRRVAVKVLPFAALLEKRQLERFKNEARAAAMLKHPHIVGVHSVGVERGLHYYAMEYIDGHSLAEVISALSDRSIASPVSSPPVNSEANVRSMSEETTAFATLSTASTVNRNAYFHAATELAVQAANALQYAHDQGVIHRDIKPSNLLLDETGQVQITDFGLAQIQGGDDLTMSGDVLGTLRYMSPEQARGNAVLDHRTDIYSLGASLYELVTLRPMLDGQDRHRILKQLEQLRPQSARSVDAEVPRDLETILLKATASEPILRYQSAADLAEDLQSFLEDRPIQARRTPRTELLRRWVRHNRAMTACAGLAMLLLVLLAVGGQFAALNKSRLNSQIQSQLREARSRAYDAQIKIAHEALQRGDIDRVKEILNRYQATSDQADPRGWEWYFLWREIRRGVETPALEMGIDIHSLVYSPDGKRFAHGDWYGSIRVHDSMSREQMVEVEEPATIGALIFSSDGKVLWSGCYDGRVRARDPISGKELYVLPRQFPGWIEALALSPDRSTLAVGYRTYAVSDKGEGPAEVQLWRVEHDATNPTAGLVATELNTFTQLPNAVNSLSFSCDGGMLAAGCHSTEVFLWDLKTSARLPSLPGHKWRVWSVSFSPTDPDLLACGSGALDESSSSGEIQLWDVDHPVLVHSLIAHTAPVHSVAFSSDGKRLASGGSDRAVRVWEIASGKLLDTVLGHSSLVTMVAFSPGDRELVSSSRDGSVRFWDLTNRAEIQLLGKHDAGETVLDTCFSPDDRHIFTSAGDGSVRCWDTKTGEQERAFTCKHPRAISIDLSVDGSMLAVASYLTSYPEVPSALELWDINKDTKLRTLIETHGHIWSTSFSPNGKHIAAGIDNALVVWDPRTGEELRRLSGHKGTIWRVAWSPLGDLIATGGVQDAVVKLWSYSSRRCVWSSQPHHHVWSSVAFSPDGSKLVAGGPAGDVVVWDVPPDGRIQQQPIQLKGHTNFVWRLRFSPGGRLVSCGRDRSVRLWNVDTGSELLRFRDHPQWVLAVAFSHNGETLASAWGVDPPQGVLLHRAARQSKVDSLGQRSRRSERLEIPIQ